MRFPRLSAYDIPFIDRPFKGLWYYEWQIGSFIFQWLHDRDHVPSQSPRKLSIGPFQVWWDSAWYRESRRRLSRLLRR